jgi:HlyD family secretion protein
VVVLAGGAAVVYWQRSAQASTSFRTVPMKRGDLLVTVGATGTVEPEEVVDVGAQVAGKIESFGQDPNESGKTIDYGSEVEVDTVLARIDDSLYQADVDQSTAQLEQAKANVLRSKADLVQMIAKLHQAENNWKRAQELGPSRALSATDYDSYEANYETAKATVAVGEATVVQAEKAVLQSEANLKRSQTNLGYCTIRSPVKGVIIDRRVNTGQTVVSSLNAPSLFLIAKDLTRIQVWVSVNEADIGSIRSAQAVTFTVDAYPGQVFHGGVGKVRLNASMTQNVVTYTVEINTDNFDGKLLPYLTANVQFEVSERKNVLLVPNAALRWKPTPQQMAPEARQESASAGRKNTEAPRTTTAPSGGKSADRGQNVVWVQDGVYVRPIRVTTGLSDGSQTEIQGDKLSEGMEIVVGEAVRTAAGNEAASPFTPQVFGNRRQ